TLEPRRVAPITGLTRYAQSLQQLIQKTRGIGYDSEPCRVITTNPGRVNIYLDKIRWRHVERNVLSERAGLHFSELASEDKNQVGTVDHRMSSSHAYGCRVASV